MQQLKYLISITLLVGAFDSVGQNLIGVKAGLNASSQRYRIEGEPVSDNASVLLSFHAGISYDYVLSDRNGVLTELLYSQEGSRKEAEQGGLRLHYLQLPVLYYFQWPSGIRAYAGPVFSYLLNARANSSGFGSDRRDAYENFVLGLTGGADYLIFKGTRSGLRYNVGLSNFLNSEFYNFDIRSHSDTFQVFVAFTFRPQ